MPNKQQDVMEILEDVRIGGYYDARPEERKPNYMDKDVALKALNAYYLNEFMNLLDDIDPLHSSRDYVRLSQAAKAKFGRDEND